MRIAIVRREYGGFGGAELYTERLIRELQQSGHMVQLLSSAKACSLPEGAEFVELKTPRSRAAKIRAFSDAVQSWKASNPVDCVFSLERISGCDVLRAGDGMHSVWLDKRREYAPWWKKFFIGRGAFHKEMLQMEKDAFDPKKTRRIIVNSEMVKRDILSRTQFRPEYIHLVRNGIDVSRFKECEGREALRKQLGASANDYVLLFIGSGGERKGLRYVIDALSVIGNNYILVIAGKVERVKRCPPNVRFLGPVSEPGALYAAADLMVFPPIYEPSSNVVYESLAAGLPVITSAENGAHEIITEGENGIIVLNPSDVGKLATAILQWRSSNGDRRVNFDYDASMRRNISETLKVINMEH